MPIALKKMRILILSALPQEYSPLKKCFPSWRRVRGGTLKKFAFSLPGKEISLIESGMGSKAVREALEVELAVTTPDLMIFSGFAGGLHPDLSVGVVCFVDSVKEISSKSEFHCRYPDELADFLVENEIRPVQAFSAEVPGNKQELCLLASGRPAVLDMETATVAEVALQKKITFICCRAISDAIGHDLGFNLSDIADERGKIRVAGVLSALIRKPSVLSAFYLAWRRSRLAAKNLGRSIAALLVIPSALLDEMLSKSRWTIVSGLDH